MEPGDRPGQLETLAYETGFGPGRVLIGGPPEGLPIVALHGYAASADQWQPLVPYLIEHYPVYLPDLLGFGDAPTPPPPYTAERWASQVLRLLDAMDLPRVVLIGHSLGGLIALAVAAHQPHRIAGLGLVASMGMPPPNAEALRRGPAGLALRLLRLPGVGEVVFYALRRRRRLARAMALGAYHVPARAPSDTVAHWFDLINRPRAHRAYVSVVRRLEHLLTPVGPGEVNAPTLIVWGAADRGMPASLVTGFQQLIPQAEIAIIPDTGHIPHSENPAATAAALLPFLANVAQQAALADTTTATRSGSTSQSP